VQPTPTALLLSACAAALQLYVQCHLTWWVQKRQEGGAKCSQHSIAAGAKPPWNAAGTEHSLTRSTLQEENTEAAAAMQLRVGANCMQLKTYMCFLQMQS
jgi:hypothetical protein